jgi:hypothetical protein
MANDRDAMAMESQKTMNEADNRPGGWRPVSQRDRFRRLRIKSELPPAPPPDPAPTTGSWATWQGKCAHLICRRWCLTYANSASLRIHTTPE